MLSIRRRDDQFSFVPKDHGEHLPHQRLLAVLFILLAGIIVLYLVRWLLSRTETQPRRTSQAGSFSSWVERMVAFLLAFWDQLASMFGSLGGPAQLYGALQVWGRRSGIARIMSETPTEYGLRLQGRFPALQKEIRAIIAAFNDEVYGEIALGEQEIARAHSAWRRLRSPLNWPSRLKTRLIQVRTIFFPYNLRVPVEARYLFLGMRYFKT